MTFSATSTDLAFLVVEIYQHACQQNPHEMLKAQKCEISENAVVKLTEDFRDGPLEKLWGGGGDFRAAGIFFRYQIKFIV